MLTRTFVSLPGEARPSLRAPNRGYTGRHRGSDEDEIFENAAATPTFSGGNMQVMTLRGGGRTALDWNAYTASGQHMRLMLPNVKENLPTLKPILQRNKMTVGPGTTLMVED